MKRRALIWSIWLASLSAMALAQDEGSRPKGPPHLIDLLPHPIDLLPPKPKPGPSCVQPPPGMTAWWPLDEASGIKANDIALFNNQGTHMNGPTPIVGKVAVALHFDGQNDFVQVPNSSDIDLGTGDFTIDAWVRTKQATGLVVLLDKRDGPTPQGYSLYLYNGKLGFQMADGDGAAACSPPPPSTPAACANYVPNVPQAFVATGKWHHIAVVVKRGQNGQNGFVKFYVGGVPVYTAAPFGAGGMNGEPPAAGLGNNSPLFMGVRSPAMGGGGYFEGDLDEVEIFKRALSDQEIKAIADAGMAGKCKCIKPSRFPEGVDSSETAIQPEEMMKEPPKSMIHKNP